MLSAKIAFFLLWRLRWSAATNIMAPGRWANSKFRGWVMDYGTERKLLCSIIESTVSLTAARRRRIETSTITDRLRREPRHLTAAWLAQLVKPGQVKHRCHGRRPNGSGDPPHRTTCGCGRPTAGTNLETRPARTSTCYRQCATPYVISVQVALPVTASRSYLTPEWNAVVPVQLIDAAKRPIALIWSAFSSDLLPEYFRLLAVMAAMIKRWPSPSNWSHVLLNDDAP